MSVPKPPPGHFTLLYFASASSYTHKAHDFFPSPMPINHLYDSLEKRYPGMRTKVLDSCALTVNLEYVDLEEDAGLVIQERDEVGIIPPVSSG